MCNSVFLFSSYETINGTAMSGSDYEAKKDVLVFKPGETLKHIDITIIDDNEWEENEVFFLKLCRFDYKDDTVEIGEQSITEVTIINDDGKLYSYRRKIQFLGQQEKMSFAPIRGREVEGVGKACIRVEWSIKPELIPVSVARGD